MKSLRYWIQRADLSATDYEPVDAAAAVRAFTTHDWAEETSLLSELEKAGKQCCPPGIGFVDPSGPILHVCPTTDGNATVHYHHNTIRKFLGIIPFHQSTVDTKQGVSRSDVADLITYFFEARNEWILGKLKQ
ncbi:MAG TPA: hypothetical protein VKH64_08790 [Candidatus Binatia bacterium]|nr:hypothetical protein [Candidatus Binatia bacterium]